MRVAIVHYHLRSGGVTRVIEQTSQALTNAGIHHVVLTGTCADKSGWVVSPQTVLGASRSRFSSIRQIPCLGYLTEQGGITADQLTHQLRLAATEALGGSPDVWHFHNPSLGKNRLITEVISQLTKENERLVLHIHDLAEQGRAANYALIAGNGNLYPFSNRIHYVFLNTRDLGIFTAAGLPAANATLLPNPISAAAPLCDLRASAVNSSPALLFAPVRGIRRKNIGELVLLSRLAPAGTRIAISRAPENPAALPIHDNWRKFSIKHQLPIGFDVVGHFSPAPGAATDFDSWVRHATHFVTTSVSEGFGLTFLESIAYGKPLLGRNLAHLTADHAKHGVQSGRLYDSILIPIEWVDITILRDHLTLDLARDYRLYQRPLIGNPVGVALAAMVRDGLIDFGNLPESLQQGIIERLADPSQLAIPLMLAEGTKQRATDWLATVLASQCPTTTRDQLEPYSLENYEKPLCAIDSRLMHAASSPVQHVPPADILTAYLRPENFHFLLSSLRPDAALKQSFRAVIFDIYGTLLIAPAGGVRPDPFTDPVIREILRQHGYSPPVSPSTKLQAAVLHHHAAAGVPFPEIDLRILWREILAIESGTDITPLVLKIEAAWHPAQPMPGAESFIQRLARLGISLGLLSNAQCNTLPALGPVADLFAPELCILSYQHRIAKPSPELFRILTDRLAGRNISPAETLFIGNDPLQDIKPAAAAGFKTALFTGHPDSLRPGECTSDFTFGSWHQLHALF